MWKPEAGSTHNPKPGTTSKNLPVNSIQFATLKIETNSSHTTRDPQNATATVAFLCFGVRLTLHRKALTPSAGHIYA
jgi:hypothetical protein